MHGDARFAIRAARRPRSGVVRRAGGGAGGRLGHVAITRWRTPSDLRPSARSSASARACRDHEHRRRGGLVARIGTRSVVLSACRSWNTVAVLERPRGLSPPHPRGAAAFTARGQGRPIAASVAHDPAAVAAIVRATLRRRSTVLFRARVAAEVEESLLGQGKRRYYWCAVVNEARAHIAAIAA